MVYSRRHCNLLFRQLFLVFLVFDDRQVSGLASFCGELWDWCLVNAEVQVFVFFCVIQPWASSCSSLRRRSALLSPSCAGLAGVPHGSVEDSSG